MGLPFCSNITSPEITHWGRHNIAAILHTTFSNAFSWTKMYEFRLTFHQNLFLSFKNCLRWWIDVDQTIDHHLDQWWLVYWRMYVSLSLNATPSHYLNKCWVISNLTLTNKLPWNFSQNTKLFVHENAPVKQLWRVWANGSHRIANNWYHNLNKTARRT